MQTRSWPLTVEVATRGGTGHNVITLTGTVATRASRVMKTPAIKPV